MATARIQNKIKQIFGNDSLEWLDRSYTVDWIVASIFWALGALIIQLPIFEREFSANDPLINHRHVSQQISGRINNMISLYVPLVVTAAVGGLRKSVMEIHHAALALWAAKGFTRFITEFLKARVGRLRPDFLSRCKWDNVLQTCTGKAADIVDGRKSFPSGHSSTAFTGMTFLSLWLAGKTAAWCFSTPMAAGTLTRSRLGRISLTLLPLIWASWVAISRVEDYRHHKEDVIVGAVIGIVSSTISYLVYWPSPFAIESFVENVGQPRATYGNSEDSRAGGAGFELTRLQDEAESV